MFSHAGLSPATQNACLGVYASWARHVSHAEALQQAVDFAQRCANLVGHDVLSEAELDDVLEAVGSAMAAP